jgi:hypothetical protein
VTRPRTFKVVLPAATIDGRNRVKLTIQVDEHGRGVATVTPHRSRVSYTVALDVAVACIHSRAVRETLATQGQAVPVARRRTR